MSKLRLHCYIVIGSHVSVKFTTGVEDPLGSVSDFAY